MSKIIKAVFTGRFCTTRRVFQWDTDDKLQIVNLDLPQSYTVDFANSLTGQSVPVLATSDTVQIPPEMFVPGSEIYAWVWISDTNGGHTRCQATIPIDPRAQRSGASPAPAQASAWDEAVNTLNETVEGIPTAINSALAEAKASGEFDGPPGPQGEPGLGFPAGGKDLYVLRKKTDTDYDAEWANPMDLMSDDVKQALLEFAEEAAYAYPTGMAIYTRLYNAFYPPKTVVLITAVFEQGSTVIYDDTSLDDLKQYLQVTAKYDDNTTSILADNAYTLSGLLEAPSSTVTVLYSGVSTTFSVAVTARPTLSSISAVYTQSGTVWSDDTLDSLKPGLVVTAAYTDGTTETVDSADYTLSGTLNSATSTITVSYGGKTTTFTVAVTLVGSTNYADALSNWLLSNAATATYADGKITMKTSQQNANSYAMWCFDRAKTLWSAVQGKKLRIRMTLDSPDWVGEFSNTNPQNRAINGVAIFSSASASTGNDRQKFASLSSFVLSASQTLEYVFTADISNFTGGTGTPTSQSTFGLSVYDASANTVHVTAAEIVEVLN